MGGQDNNSHLFAHPEMLQLQPVAVLLSHIHFDLPDTKQWPPPVDSQLHDSIQLLSELYSVLLSNVIRSHIITVYPSCMHTTYMYMVVYELGMSSSVIPYAKQLTALY